MIAVSSHLTLRLGGNTSLSGGGALTSIIASFEGSLVKLEYNCVML